MTGHIALAGFVLTAEEWAELEPELDGFPIAAIGVGSGPIDEPPENPPVVSITATGSVVVEA